MIDVAWFDSDKKIVMCSFHGAWTWYECREAVQTITFMQDSVDYRLHYIYDFTQSRLTARRTMSNLRRLLRLRVSPAPVQIIMIERRMRIHLMIDVVRNLFRGLLPADLYFVDTMTGAFELLAENKEQSVQHDRKEQSVRYIPDEIVPGLIF